MTCVRFGDGHTLPFPTTHDPNPTTH
jgi:hypothetical protein